MSSKQVKRNKTHDMRDSQIFIGKKDPNQAPAKHVVSQKIMDIVFVVPKNFNTVN